MQPFDGVMQAGADGAFTNVQAACDLREGQVHVEPQRDNQLVIRRQIRQGGAQDLPVQRLAEKGSPFAVATSSVSSSERHRAFRFRRLRQVLTRMRSNHGSKLEWSRSVDHFRQACTNASCVASCRFGRIPEDGAGQPIARLQVLIGQAAECALPNAGRSICDRLRAHSVNLRAWRHDDTTIRI